MRLLHVISRMDPSLGGVSQAVRSIIAGLAEQGVHNEVASLDAPGTHWEVHDAFSVHALGPGRGPWDYSRALGPWLLANLARFDAVILHGLWLYPGYALHKAWRRMHTQGQASRSAKESLPKLFVMPHGMLDPYFQRAGGRKLKAWRNWAYWKFIESAVINDATGVLFTCETERQLAREPFAPYHPQQELVVGLGVEEPPPYTPAMRTAFLAKCPELASRPYLLFLSRIHEKKGVELLLQAYAHTTREAPVGLAPTASAFEDYTQAEAPALVIAGPGLDTVYGQQMQQLAAQLPATTAVQLLGMLTGDAKWGAFYGCHAFVLPSHQENFGIAVAEALACGKPVLISNQVNIWFEIEEAGGGLIAEDTAAGTSQLLQRWNQLPKNEKQEMGKRARQAYEKYFAIAAATHKMYAALTA